MSTTKKIGNLLISIDNAVSVVFGDYGYVTDIRPSFSYNDDGVILHITITVLKRHFTDDEYEKRREILDNLIYNPLFHSEDILSKVDIEVNEYG